VTRLLSTLVLKLDLNSVLFFLTMLKIFTVSIGMKLDQDPEHNTCQFLESGTSIGVWPVYKGSTFVKRQLSNLLWLAVCASSSVCISSVI